MTERDDELLPDGVPPFDDAAYDDLRGLLADARVTEPMPADVADRLDSVLAGLKSESTVVPLAPRRGRAGARLLTAAAVVIGVVGGGYGLSQVVGPTGGNDDKAMSGTSAERADGGSATGDAGGGNDSLARDAAVPVVRKAAFASDAARVLADPPSTVAQLQETLGGLDTRAPLDPSAAPAVPSPAASEMTSGSTAGPQRTETDLDGPPLTSAYAAKSAACTPPILTGTTAYPILLDGRPATLVVHPAANGQRLVQAWSCNGKRVLATAAVPG